MQSTPDLEESDLLKKVDRGLEIAVRDGGLGWEDEEKLTKREKYRFIAIDDLSEDELPVTYSWYEYGISAIADKGYVSDSMPIPEMEATIFEFDEEDIAEYYKNDLQEMHLNDWWDEPILIFLEEFYNHYCPEHLRNVYLANIELRKILENRVLHRINKEGTGVPREDFEGIQEVILNIQTELASDQEQPAFNELTLRDLYDDFLLYSEILEDAVLAIALRDEVEPYGPENRAIGQLKSVFDDTVWPLITSIISYRTVRGPNPSHIQKTAQGKFESLQSKRGDSENTHYEEEISKVKSTCRNHDLIPDPGEYPSEDTDVSDTVDELMSVIDGNRDE